MNSVRSAIVRATSNTIAVNMTSLGAEMDGNILLTVGVEGVKF